MHAHVGSTGSVRHLASSTRPADSLTGGVFDHPFLAERGERTENSWLGEFWSILQRGRRGFEEANETIMRVSGKPIEAFIKLNENAPYGQGAGQMNKLLKINLTNYCLSHLRVSHAWLGTQSKGADAGRSWGVTTSCLGNYHHFWHELRGLLTASLLLLNSLLRWLMMKREHAPTPLLGLWHNVLCIPCDPASWAG